MWLLQGVLVTVFPKWTESFMVLVMLELLWEGCCFCRARSVLSVVLARNSYVDTVIYFSGCESGRTARCGAGVAWWFEVTSTALCAGQGSVLGCRPPGRWCIEAASKDHKKFYWSGQLLAFLCLLFLSCCKSLMAVTLCFSLPRGDTTDVTKNLPGCDVLACGFSPLWAVV